MANKASIILLDPHGDLVDAEVAQLPEHAIPRTYVFDLADEAHPFGLNPFAARHFATSAALGQAVTSVEQIWLSQWPELAAQAAAPRYLRAATITLFMSPSTVLDLPRLFLEDSFRQAKLKYVTDPTVLQFWQTQYEDLSPSARLQRVEALLARFDAVLMGHTLVRNILQGERPIDFRQAIMRREIFLFKLLVKLLGSDAYLLGRIIIAQIHSALFSFADLPPDQRPGVSLYVDEVQHFSLPLLNELFTEGRKFGMKLTIAHQYRNQLPSYLQDSTMTARTKICFQVTPEDSRELAPIFMGGK